MKSVWSLKANFKPYSIKGEQLFESIVNKVKKDVIQEMRHHDQFEVGSRFACDGEVFWALQSNVKELDFLSDPEYHLFSVLLGAGEADYYYINEKEW